MVNSKPDNMKVKIRTVSLSPKDNNLVLLKLNTFGEFSGFISYCLNDDKLIEQYKNSRL